LIADEKMSSYSLSVRDVMGSFCKKFWINNNKNTCYLNISLIVLIRNINGCFLHGVILWNISPIFFCFMWCMHLG
jgi:hypothetical protein